MPICPCGSPFPHMKSNHPQKCEDCLHAPCKCEEAIKVHDYIKGCEVCKPTTIKRAEDFPEIDKLIDESHPIKSLTNYWQACNDLLGEFIMRYYIDEETELKDVESYWIVDDVGGVVQINDQFYDMYDIAKAIELDAPVDKFWEWKYYSDDEHFYGRSPINLTNYLKKV
jgi:hypothetical protein